MNETDNEISVVSINNCANKRDGKPAVLFFTYLFLTKILQKKCFDSTLLWNAIFFSRDLNK